MRLGRSGTRAAHGSATALLLAAVAACGNASSGAMMQDYLPGSGSNHAASASSSGSSSASSSGSGSSSGGIDPSSSRSSSSSAPSATGDDGGSSESAGDTDAATTGSEAGDDAPATTQPEAAPTCVKGQVTANEVVMLGDSYLDPAWGNIGPTLMMQAGAMYRHYYIGGAAMAWGNPNTQFYIPYQFDPMALTDVAVMNPSDVKVVIMDGGGNDVLIGNTSCETTAPPTNTSCVTTVQNAIDEAQTKMHEMAQKGVQNVVFFFYPHLSTAGGGILQTPAPAVNDTLDYAYPLAEKICCGSTFTSSLTNYSCSGQPVAGMNCVFIDTRPAFEGHIADYIKSDNVHPTQAGATVISNLIWEQMQAHCIAQ